MSDVKVPPGLLRAATKALEFKPNLSCTDEWYAVVAATAALRWLDLQVERLLQGERLKQCDPNCHAAYAAALEDLRRLYRVPRRPVVERAKQAMEYRAP